MDTDTVRTFVNSRAELLHRWSVPCTLKSPKAVCVMVHGLHDHITQYKEMAQTMLKTEEIVLHGCDLVGHGLSEGRRADIEKFRYYVDDLIEFVSIIRSEYKSTSTPLYIIGHNMGGLILGLALLKEPELCDGAIMYSAMIKPHPKFVFNQWVAGFLSYYVPWFPVGCFEPENLTSNHEAVCKLKTDHLRYQGGIKARLAQHMFDAIAEFEPRMSLIKTPMLILHGTEDNVCLAEGSQLLHDMIGSSDKQVKIFQGRYHRLHTEPDGTSDQFVTDICNWITSQVSKINQ